MSNERLTKSARELIEAVKRGEVRIDRDRKVYPRKDLPPDRLREIERAIERGNQEYPGE